MASTNIKKTKMEEMLREALGCLMWMKRRAEENEKHGICTVGFMVDFLNKEEYQNMKKAIIAIFAYIMSDNESQLSNNELFQEFKKDIIDVLNKKEIMIDEEIKEVVLNFMNS